MRQTTTRASTTTWNGSLTGSTGFVEMRSVVMVDPDERAPDAVPAAAGSPVGREGVVEEPLAKVPAGDSTVQRQAEGAMLDALTQELGCPLTSERIHLPDGSYVDVDGVSHEPPVLVEAWAHQGAPKAAQRNKVLADALKLMYVGGLLGSRHRLVLCFSDPDAARPFSGRSWYAGALRDRGVEVRVVDLSPDWRARIMEAQRRQYR